MSEVRSGEGYSALCEVPIIAILAAILFPVVAPVREKALMTTCLSTMKQIGTGLML